MSYAHAFHTSCRTGLSGHSGFQYNAASPGLDEEQLARIARTHVGYRVPPGAPREPSPEQIAELPISLRYHPVDGVGRVVSRTAYVGREFRGGPSGEDSGRFGNYFSHIVVDDAGEQPFGGLLPIELWGAPHWRTEESAGTELKRLPELIPGPVDLDEVLARLLPRRRGGLIAVLDPVLKAVFGGPRVVVIEPDPALAPMWVALACFALPLDQIGELTFSTFDGRPRQAESVRLCLTTPDCDVAFAPYELGSTAIVIDAAGAAHDSTASSHSLYARVVASLVAEGGEAVLAAVRGLPAGLELDAAGAELAVRAQRTDLAESGEVADVVTVLGTRLGRVPGGQLAGLAAELPPAGGDPAAIRAWSGLHALARHSETPDSVAITDESLRRVLGSLDGAPVELAEARAEWPTVPSPGVLAGWLKLVSGAVGTADLGPLLFAGARLGLIGCNTALDRGVADLIAAGFGDPQVRQAYERIVAQHNDLVVRGVALALAAVAVADGPSAAEAVDHLREVAADPAAREAVRAHAEEDGGFDAAVAWELLRAGDDPARRASSVVALVARAQTAAHQERIRMLYGPEGPQTPEEHAELLNGWTRAGLDAPRQDCLEAAGCLATLPFSEREQAVPLFRLLRDTRVAAELAGELLPWQLKLEPPPKRKRFSAWARDIVWATRRQAASGRREREAELRTLAADIAVAGFREADYEEGIETLVAGMDGEWPQALGDALGKTIAASLEPERVIAAFFVRWYRLRGCRGVLLGDSLPRATRDTSPKRLEAVAELLREADALTWEKWLEEHPPRRPVSRAVRGVIRRGEGKRR
jgi:hypothetical protein